MAKGGYSRRDLRITYIKDNHRDPERKAEKNKPPLELALPLAEKATRAGGNIPSAAQTMDETFPDIVIAGKSITSTTNIRAYHKAVTSAISKIGTFGGLAVAYQGERALSRMAVHLENVRQSTETPDFSRIVCDLINEQLSMNPDTNGTEHAFFIYHPDTYWTQAFSAILRNSNEGLRDQEGRYQGHTNNLDFAIILMKATRRLHKKQQNTRGSKKELILHLLIPACRPLLIEEAVCLPEALKDVRIYGKIHDSTEYVWINLPQEQKRCLRGVGRFQPVQNWGQSLWSRLWGQDRQVNRRILGSRALDLDDAGYESDKASFGSSDSDRGD